jgi:hypothetical protein
MHRWAFAALPACWLVTMTPARAQHTCDPVEDAGWRMLATTEVTGVKDSAPYQVGGDWVIDRTTTLLPLCNYFNAIGNYSLRSYSLEPIEKIERIVICRGATAIAPYAGSCPPKQSD